MILNEHGDVHLPNSRSLNNNTTKGVSPCLHHYLLFFSEESADDDGSVPDIEIDIPPGKCRCFCRKDVETLIVQ